MLLLASEKVSRISFGDQILASGDKKRTLRVVFPYPTCEAVLDQEDANLVGDGRGSSNVGYGSDGSENGLRLDEGGSEWACWLSRALFFLCFVRFPCPWGALVPRIPA